MPPPPPPLAGASTYVIGMVHVSAALQQQPPSVRVADVGCPHQRREPALLASGPNTTRQHMRRLPALLASGAQQINTSPQQPARHLQSHCTHPGARLDPAAAVPRPPGHGRPPSAAAPPSQDDDRDVILLPAKLHCGHGATAATAAAAAARMHGGGGSNSRCVSAASHQHAARACIRLHIYIMCQSRAVGHAGWLRQSAVVSTKRQRDGRDRLISL